MILVYKSSSNYSSDFPFTFHCFHISANSYYVSGTTFLRFYTPVFLFKTISRCPSASHRSIYPTHCQYKPYVYSSPFCHLLSQSFIRFQAFSSSSSNLFHKTHSIVFYTHTNQYYQVSFPYRLNFVSFPVSSRYISHNLYTQARHIIFKES